MKKTTKKVVTATATAPAPLTAKTPLTPPATATAAPKPTAVGAAPGKAAAPVKAAPLAPPAPAKTPLVNTVAPITIEAKIDVGFGNNVFVRGQGAGLSWERGTPLECVDSKTWRLTVPAQDKLQFKLLLNDAVWAQGEDVVATPGKRVEVTPAF